MLTVHLPGVSTIRHEQMVEQAEFHGINDRKDFLNLSDEKIAVGFPDSDRVILRKNQDR